MATLWKVQGRRDRQAVKEASPIPATLHNGLKYSEQTSGKSTVTHMTVEADPVDMSLST